MHATRHLKNSHTSILPCLAIVILLAILASCKSKTGSHKDMAFTSETADGKLKKECIAVADSEQIDYRHHCKLYFKNGTLAQEGDYLNDTIEIGWHTFYRENGTLKARREFLKTVQSGFHLNRVIRYDEKGDTLKSQSNYYTISYERDTVKVGEELHAYFEITAPFYDASYIEVYLTNASGEEIQLPGTKTLSSELIAKIETKGAYDLNGFIEEIKQLSQKGDSIKFIKRRLYFSKKYWAE